MVARRLHAGFVIVSMLWLFTSSASAMLHPQQGRFMQRDPLGYVDGMGLYEPYSSNPSARVDPSGLEFVDQGRVGQSTLWWFGGTAGLGRQNIGSIQSEVPPEIVVAKKKNGLVCAHVKKNTGIARVERGYTGTQAGDQGVGAAGSFYAGRRGYVSQKLASALDAHEQGHVDASEAILGSTLAVAEAQAQAYWTKEICCCPNKQDRTGPAEVLKSRIAWDHWKREFVRLDNAVNGGPGTFHAWETQQGGGPTATAAAGAINGVRYDIILRSREETEAAYKVPNYGAFAPAQPIAPAKPLTCNQMAENALP